MYKKIILLFFFSIAYFEISAQNKNFFISIDLQKQPDLNGIEKHNLPIYHITNDILFTEASEDLLKLFKEERIEYKIIDDNPAGNKYYLVTTKDKTSTISIDPSKIIYRDVDNIICKNVIAVGQKRFDSKNLFVEVNKKPFNYRNEKIVEGKLFTAGIDSTIKNVVNEINADSIRYFIQSLQNFNTRFLLSNKRDSVAKWIEHQFLRMGYTDVKIDSFYQEGVWNKNVIATLHALNGTQQEIVVGGHHDSYSSGNPMIYAPGADDNASGTSAVLEIARVLKKTNYLPEVNIKLITFAAEEYGLYGGFDYAMKARKENKKIKLMINHDMISNNSSPITDSKVNINYYTGSEYYRSMAIESTDKFSSIKAMIGEKNSSGSDSYAFWSNGYPSVYFEEYNFSPVYHSPNDIISNCNMDYCAEVIKGSCATLISAEMIPSSVQNLTVTELGTGNSLKLNWNSVADVDLVGYQIYIGKNSGAYDVIYKTSDTTFVVPKLQSGTKYYLGVAAYDKDNNISMIVEKVFTPYINPLSPTGLVDKPKPNCVELIWNHNNENDLLGYNVYRSEPNRSELIKLNQEIIKDTFYVDTTPQAGVYYTYTVMAMDSALHQSEGSIIKSRAVTLDQGILLVNNSSTYTNEEQADEFYNYVFTGYRKENYSINKNGLPKLADLCAFSSIIWLKDDFSVTALKDAVINVLQQYLQFGGKLAYAGFLPSKLFDGNAMAQKDYASGSFIYDYMKIKHSFNLFGSRCIGATPEENDYPPIFTDSSKADQSLWYHLKNIESILPNDEAKSIYSFFTKYDTLSSAGKLKGTSIGVEYLGSDYKSITLSFPLFYMNREEAKELIENILANKFTETTSIAENNGNEQVKDYILNQNYPNPFNPSTIIRYSIPRQSHVTLKVFDILGKEIAVLVDKEQQIGSYNYTFSIDNYKLSSGIYFYQIKADNFFETKKMMFLK